MISGVLGKRYGRAVIELAQDAGLVDEVERDLERLAEVFRRSEDLVIVFSNPTLGRQSKARILDDILKILGVQDLTARFVHVLLKKNRIQGVGGIQVAYQELSDEIQNRVRARVVTAVPIDKKNAARLQKALAELSGKDVVMQAEVDGSLLGGVITYLGCRVYNGSLVYQLKRIQDTLAGGR